MEQIIINYHLYRYLCTFLTCLTHFQVYIRFIYVGNKKKHSKALIEILLLKYSTIPIQFP